MQKRIRLQRLAGNGSFVQEVTGEKITNSIFIMTRAEAASLFMDLNDRYGFIAEIANVFPKELFREVG